METRSCISRIATKGVTLLTSLLFAFALCMAFVPTTARADTIKANVATANCDVIGEYLYEDLYYIELDSYADYVVFTDVDPDSMQGDFSGIMGIDTNSYYFQGTNEAIIRNDVKVTLAGLQESDSVELDEDAIAGLDFSNAYGFTVMTDDDEVYSFIVQVPEQAGPSGGAFRPSIGTVGELEEDAYSYTDWNGSEVIADQYTLTIPYGTTTLDLSFDDAVLAYGYDENDEYVSSGSDADDYYIVGDTSASFAADENALFPAYIQVQTPYGDSWSNTLLYAIKIQYSYTFTASIDGTAIEDITFTPNDYTYLDYMTGKTANVGSFTLKIPEGTETVDLEFSDNVLVYNYTKQGDYLGGFYVDFETGGKTASVMVDYSDSATQADGEFDCIQVQSPYDAAYNSTLFYVITFDDGSSDNPDDPDDPSGTDYDVEAIKKAAGEKLAASLDQSGEIYGQEWLVMDSARDGNEISDEYIESVISKLEETDGVIHTGAGDYTNYAKTILALTASGYDATAIKGYDLTEALADIDAVTKQGINGAAYALLALDSHDYADPGDGTRDDLISFILSEELDGGGWAWSGTIPDSDMTAIVIQALAPYAETNSDAKAAIDRGIALLSSMQKPSGGFASEAGDGGTENSNSVAQVIIALTSVGIDPTTDPRFIKDGNTTVDALCSYALEDGGFGYTNNKTYNALATQQGHYALMSLFRFLDEENALYDMTDVDLKGVYDAADILDAGDTGATAEGTVILPAGEEDPVLVIEKIGDYDPDYVKTQFALSADGKIVGFYSVTLMQDGKEIHSDFGNIDVTFSVDASYNGWTVTLHHLHADGKLSTDTATVANGTVTFSFTDLSDMVLEATGNPGQGDTPSEGKDNASGSSSTTPNTGDETMPIAGSAVLTIASLLVMLIAWRRKGMTL